MQNIILNKNDFFIYISSFFQLMKPRVMSLVIFTCVVGLLIAPEYKNLLNSIISILAVALGAGASGTLNMWYEADVDALMQRTCLRPIPTGKISRKQALIFGILTSIFSVVTLYLFSNLLSASILAFTIFFYVVIYTIWLKKRTPQNIVIGGAAGALPPVIGWTIATGSLSFEPILLFLIIFIWTPSHFWALSLYKTEDYKKASIPMLPIVSGVKVTKINILVYSVILFFISLLPYYLNYSGITYFASSLILGIYYIYLCLKLLLNDDTAKNQIISIRIFVYSIFYLFLIFSIILLDKLI